MAVELGLVFGGTVFQNECSHCESLKLKKKKKEEVPSTSWIRWIHYYHAYSQLKTWNPWTGANWVLRMILRGTQTCLFRLKGIKLQQTHQCWFFHRKPIGISDFTTINFHSVVVAFIVELYLNFCVIQQRYFKENTKQKPCYQYQVSLLLAICQQNLRAITISHKQLNKCLNHFECWSFNFKSNRVSRKKKKELLIASICWTHTQTIHPFRQIPNVGSSLHISFSC